ncbi:MAG: DUF5688 family protein [Lachnospiraceae bacterium]|nr:DUF5688 family protein [Muribaculum sp.]MCM1409918.1 DUF5688 family protein [Lachnospiraceae bacterium]
MDEFRKEVIEELKRRLGNKYQILPYDKVRNNEITLHGICICHENAEINPIIYLEEYILHYIVGIMTLEEIADDLLEKYYKDKMPMNVADHLKEFSMMRDRIRIKVINYGANSHRLERIPYRRFLDLAIVYYLDMEIRLDSGNATVEISNRLMRIWNVSEGDLYRIGMQNMSAKDSFYSDEIIGKIRKQLRIEPNEKLEQVLKDFEENAGPEAEVYVVSNKKRLYGACCLLNRPFLQELAERTESNLIIYPINIVETMICPIEKGNKNHRYLKEMREINDKAECKEDCLSNSIYLYDKTTQEVSIYEEGAPL